jgi:2-polyprenyl-3-methyl-5-hydroxy-6-metoxy-1,4-benzoquinol methylase
VQSASPHPWSPWAREYARDPDRYVFGTAPSDWAREIAQLVRPGDVVLDLGCGEGRDSVFLAGLGAAVTGVDVAAGGLDKARRLARRRGVRVRWIEGAMTEALPEGSSHPAPYTTCRGPSGARCSGASRP